MVDLVIVVPHLGSGGVQRVVSTLASAWSRAGREIVIVTLYADAARYEVDPGVRVVSVLDRPAAPLLLRLVEGLRLVLGRAGAALREAARRATAWLGLVAPETPPVWLLVLAGVADRLAPLALFEALLLRLPRHPRLDGVWKLYLPAWLRVRALRAIVAQHQPHVLLGLCGSTNVMTALAGDGLAIPVVISERNDPAQQHLERPWQAMRRRYYDRADVVSANTRGALVSLREFVAPSKLCFVPNPLVRPEAAAGVRYEDGDRPTVLSVGRLHVQKAQDVLLRAFAALRPGLAAWRLAFVGEGPREAELRALAGRLGISDRVDWVGQVADPVPHYLDARIFALPSLHEGTPNALLEAMSLGLPVVVSDASPGPLELVEHDVTGLVVRTGDVASLAAALERLAADPALRERLGRAARDRVEEYDLPNALRAWESMLGMPPTASGAWGEPRALRGATA